MPSPSWLSPTEAMCLPLNRCNLPARLITALSYQLAPVPLQLDGVLPFHADLFRRLDRHSSAAERARGFCDYLAVHFRLPSPELEGWPEADEIPRPHAHYRRMLLGWLFDSESVAGAAWRGWVESRFGLRPLYHREPIHEFEDASYLAFRRHCAEALYNTNDLPGQLDLLYSFCQYELARRYPNQRHLALFRGGDEQAMPDATGRWLVHYNNLSSFTRHKEEAFRFGPRVYAVQVPLTKIVCYEGLLPSPLDGEGECMVLGGCYQVQPVR